MLIKHLITARPLHLALDAIDAVVDMFERRVIIGRLPIEYWVFLCVITHKVHLARVSQ